MLYNPEWQNTTTKPDVFSLEGLIAWLEHQPADKRYCWGDAGACLCSQYFVGGGDGWGRMHRKFEVATGIRVDAIAHKTPHTFGAALGRARALRDR